MPIKRTDSKYNNIIREIWELKNVVKKLIGVLIKTEKEKNAKKSSRKNSK